MNTKCVLCKGCRWNKTAEMIVPPVKRVVMTDREREVVIAVFSFMNFCWLFFFFLAGVGVGYMAYRISVSPTKD